MLKTTNVRITKTDGVRIKPEGIPDTFVDFVKQNNVQKVDIYFGAINRDIIIIVPAGKQLKGMHPERIQRLLEEKG